MDTTIAKAWMPTGATEFERVTGFDHFTHAVGGFIRPRPGQRNRFLFRGVPDAGFDLRPSLARLTDDRPWLTVDDLHHLETTSTDDFRDKAHLVLDPRFIPSSTSSEGESLHWWQVLQHHGGVTRLLDWSASQYVALYFAVCDKPQSDGAVWMVDYGGIVDRAVEFHPEGDNKGTNPGFPLASSSDPKREAWKDSIVFRPCTLPNERMVAQSGWYSVASLPEVDHAVCMANLVLKKSRPGEWTRKIVIPQELKRGFCRDLLHMNITHATLFPGLDGLALSFARRADLLDPGPIQYIFEHGLLAYQERAKWSQA